MANRFWVGGAGTWDGTSTTHWSASSGGASGASAPSGSDNAIFDSSSGVGNVSIEYTASALLIIATGFAGSFSLLTGASLRFESGVTHSCTSFTGPASNVPRGNALVYSSSGSQATIDDTSGTNTLDYITATDIAFSGGAIWLAGTGFVDGGNNTGISGGAVGLVTNGLFGDVA